MDRFEESADMRLLELQRRALGKEAPPRSNWMPERSDTTDGIALEEPPAPQLQGARIAVTLSASPDRNLIAGAVVTVTLVLHNEGSSAATGFGANVPVPVSMGYRPGTFMIDGRTGSEADAEAFFGPGYTFAKLEAHQRLSVLWKLDTFEGTTALTLSPHVTAKDAAVLGAAPVALKRGEKLRKQRPVPPKYLPPSPEPERPFYELDSEEEATLDKEFEPSPSASHEAPLFVMPEVLAPEPQPEVLAPEPQPEVLAPEPQPAPEPQTPPALEPPAQPRLFCTIDGASLRLIKKLFESSSFGQLPHYSLQNSLACVVADGGKDLGLQAHFSAQNAMLGRALLMRRLGKTVNAGEFSRGTYGFEKLKDVLAAPEERTKPSQLYLDLTQADVDFCAPVADLDALPGFIRLRQLAVALQCRNLAHEDDVVQRNIERLLQAYATAARNSINRTFVRSKLDRNFDVFGAVDAATDDLARELITELEKVL